MSDTTELPPAMLDVTDYAEGDELAVEVMRRLAIHRSLILTDDGLGTFPDFLIYARWGVFIVRGAGNRPLGTFASIAAAIHAGRSGPRDGGAGDGGAEMLS